MIKLSDHGIERLKIHEGCVLHRYRCTAGYLTFGYGHNIDANPLSAAQEKLSQTSPQKLADDLLADDIAKYERCISKQLPWLAELHQPRIDVNVNLAFNMGCDGWVSGWPITVQMISHHNFRGAAEELRRSKYRRQVENRALELANQLESGIFQHSHIAFEDDNPSIRQIQFALNRIEPSFSLIVDGIAGQETSKAITKFQSARGLATGSMTIETLEHLGMA